MEDTSTLDKEFNEAVNYIQNSKDSKINISNADKLNFYALFKQATKGVCKGNGVCDV